MDRISMLDNKITQIKSAIYDAKINGDESCVADLSIDLAEAQAQLRFAWADDEEQYNYAFDMQEFNLDGSLKHYD